MTVPTSPDPEPPKVWLAVLLSMLGMGLGQLYCGRVARAVAIFVGLEGLAFVSSAWFATGPVSFFALVAFVLVALATNLAIWVDAAWCARAGRRRFHGRGAVIGACVAYALVSGVAAARLEMLRGRCVGESFYLPSEGMLPTLLVGDHVFSSPLSYATAEPRRGDIVIFTAGRDGRRIVPADRAPDLPRERFVKRIVGIPGDTVEFDGHVLVLNGERKTGTFAVGRFTDAKGTTSEIVTEGVGGREYQVLDIPSRSVGSVGPVLVEPERYFVVGDNRDNSYDSRFWGTVHRDDIAGPTGGIYWSWDFRGSYIELLSPRVWYSLLATKTRWDRIGRATN